MTAGISPMARIIRHPEAQEDLVLALGSLKIRWIIGPKHDRMFARQILLPWALPAARLLSPEAETDVTVGIFLDGGDEARVREFYDTPGLRFTLTGEPELRAPVGDGVYGFFQDPQLSDDPRWVRYSPVLLTWTSPLSAAKTKPLSAIEGSKRAWRVKTAKKLGKRVGYLDGFGSGFRRPLGGYHQAMNHPLLYEKHLGLADYAFHFAQERLSLPDYLTEKFFDPILCECVPVYAGCTNMDHYAVPECFIPHSEVRGVNWRNWQAEHARRLRYVRHQKELIRTTFNFLSYFSRLAISPELLDDCRPLSLLGRAAVTAA
jgi:Glycosyltransferase family 10 (fucosyltransferase) C-term